jgi:hypothetical protein
VHEAGGSGETQKDVLTRRALMGGGIAAGALLALKPWRHGRGAAAAVPTDPAAAAGGTGAGAAPGAGLEIVPRAAWGANEARRGPAEYDGAVEKLVVHHTAIDDGSGNWARQVREIYESEITNGYRDIAYHYLVDPNGRIYEGRWARTYPAGVAANGEDAHGHSVRGGHTRGHNPRTLGVALLGNYNHAVPSDAALGALVDLLVWKCARWKIDPQGATKYANAHGGHETFANIVSHGHLRPTQCPGAHLDALVPNLRASTARALASNGGHP